MIDFFSDDFFSGDLEPKDEFSDDFFDITPQEKPEYTGEGFLGAMGDLGRGLWEGTLDDLIGGAMKAGEWVSEEGSVLEDAFASGGDYIQGLLDQNPELFEESEAGKRAREENWLNPRGWIHPGMKSVGPMVGAALTGPAAPATLGMLYYGRTSQDALEKSYDLFPEWEDDKRMTYANTKGVIEGGGEAIQMALFRGLWKNVPSSAKGSLLKGAAGATKPGIQFIKKFLGMVTGEEITETGQEYTGRATDYWYGVEKEMPTVTQAFKDVFGPTLIASTIMGSGGSIAQVQADKRLNQNLSHIDTPRDVRTQAAAEVYRRVKSKDKELADQWWESIQFNLMNNQPLIIGADVDYTQQLDPDQTALDEIGEEAPPEPTAGTPTIEEPFDDTAVPFDQVAAEQGADFEAEPALDVTGMMEGPTPETDSPFVDVGEPAGMFENFTDQQLEESKARLEAAGPVEGPSDLTAIQAEIEKRKTAVPEIPEESARELKQEAIQEVEAQVGPGVGAQEFDQRVDALYAEKVQQWSEVTGEPVGATEPEPGMGEDVEFPEYDARVAEEIKTEQYDPELPEAQREAFVATRRAKAVKREAIDEAEEIAKEERVPADVKKRLQKEAKELVEADPAIGQMREIRKSALTQISKKSFGADFDLDTLKDIPGHTKLFTNAGKRSIDEVADELGYEGDSAMLEAFRSAGTQKAALDRFYTEKVNEWMYYEDMAERDLAGLKEGVTGVPKKLSIPEGKKGEKVFTAADIKKALPGEVQEVEGGFIVTLPNKSRIGVNLVGEISIDREAAKRAGYSQEQIDKAKAAATWMSLTDTDGLIELSKIANVTDLNHETFHAAMELVLTPDEIADVLSQFEREEDAAKAYGDWAADQDAPHSAFQKIADFFKKLVNGLMGGEKAVFARIKKGEAFKRKVRAKMKYRIPVSQWTPDMVADQLSGRNRYSLQETFSDVDVESPEFQAWFGDSKVVDENGEPLVVYHGTKADFDQFDPSKIGEKYGLDRKGFFFTSSKFESGLYAVSDAMGDRSEGGSVLPVYLSLKNPLIIDEKYADDKWGTSGPGIVHPSRFMEFMRDEMFYEAEKGGHDGIILDDGERSFYMSFSPTQIKSAISNTGEFSSVDSRIQYSLNHDNHESNISMKSQEQLWYSDMVMALNENLPDKAQTQDKWQKQISELGDRFKTKRIALRDDNNVPTGDVRVAETHVPGKFRRSELEWSGVLPWLSTQSGSISKDQVMSYLDANLPKLGEVVLSEYEPDFRNDVRRYFDDVQDEVIANGGVTTITDDMDNRLRIEMDSLEPNDDTATVTVYRGDDLKGKSYLGFEEFIDGVVTQGEFDEFVWPTVRHDSLQTSGPATGYRELVITLDGEDLGYRRAEHFPIKNVVVHARFNTRVDAAGRRTLHVEEIQSDHLQETRKVLPLRKVSKPESIVKLAQDFFGTELSSHIPLRQVDGGVLALINNDEILRHVISLLPVDVVDDLGGTESATNNLLGNPSMIYSSLPVDRRPEVALAILNTARDVEAILRTKFSGLAAGRDTKLLPTLKASDLNPREVVSLLAPQTLYHFGLPNKSVTGDIASTGAKNALSFDEFAVRDFKDLPAGDTEFLDTPIVTGPRAKPSGRYPTDLGVKGFSTSIAEALNRHNDLQVKLGTSQQVSYTASDIKSMPFEKERPALAVKRLLRWATDNGYDQMTWTTGAQQEDRFSGAFLTAVDKIRWKLAGGVYAIDAEKNGKKSFSTDFDLDGNSLKTVPGFTGTPHMSDIIGKNLSGKIMSAEKSKGTFEGEELADAGEHFQKFYDKELVDTVNRIVRPFGSTVDTAEINIAEAEDLPAVNVPVHSVDITEKMKETVPGGASMWSRAKYSLGEFAAPDTESKEFKTWFGDSKVVDENGEPLVVYHGTVAYFESFDPKRIGSKTDYGWLGEGMYFTPLPGSASLYATTIKDRPFTEEVPTGSRVIPVYLSAKNPFITDKAISKSYAEQLREEGHDSIFWHDKEGDISPREIVVFEPTQIKSAISNTGEFSPTDPRIKYSLGASEPWHSTLGRAAGELKQEKGSPDQMLAMLKKSPGVKQEEIDWVGLEDWMMGKKSVTKQEIVGYLDSKDIGLEETISEEGTDLVFSIGDKAVVFSTVAGDNSVNITDINPDDSSGEDVAESLKRMISWATTNGYDEISWDEDVFGVIPEEEISTTISKYGTEVITDEMMEGFVATKYFDLTTPLKNKAIGGMPKFSLVPGKTKPIQHADKMQGLINNLRDNQTDIITKQRELARYIQRSLPIPERGRRELISRITRLALPKTKKTREKYFQAALEMIDQRVEKVEHKTAMDKIFDKLKKLKPAKKEGKITGKLGAEAHAILNRIEATLNTSPEEAARLHESAMREIGETMESMTLEQQETVYLLTRFADLKNRNSVDAWRALEDIVTIEETGRFQFQAEEDRRKYQNEQLTQTAVSEFTGEEDITLDDIIKKKRERKQKEKTILGSFQKNISGFDSMHQSWEWMLDKLSKYSKGEVLKGETTDHFRRSAHTAQTDFDYGVSQQTDKMREASERIFGATKRGLEKILIGNSVEVEDTGVYVYKEGTKNELSLSQNEAYKLWQWLQDETLLENMAEHGYTKETEKELEKFMTPEVKEWAEWQIYEFYPKYYDSINKVYNRMYHVDLPYNPSYTPMARERGQEVTDDLLLQANTPYASTMNGGLKLRVENKLPPRLSDGDAILSQHITQMEHFKAWSEPVREMRAVLGSSMVQGAIDAYHGTSAKTVIQKFLDDFARGGVDRAQVLRGLDLMRSNFVKAVIGVNPVVFAKQLTSFPAYATDMPVHMFMAGIADFVSDPVKKGKVLMTSKKMKARYEKGWERDIAAAMKKAAPAGIADVKSLTDILMFPTKMGDKFAILVGGWAQYKYNYDRYRKQGIPKEKAHAKAIVDFEMATERSQQASDVKDLGHFQRGGSLYKLFTMFMTSPQAYYRHVSGGYRNLINQRGSTAENLKRIAIAQFVLPMLFQFVASGFEWDDEDQMRAILMGPLNGLFILKDFAEPLVETAVAGRMPRFGNELPIFTPVKALGYAMLEAQKLMTGGDGDVGKMIDKTISGLSKTNIPWIGGVPYDPMRRLATGMYAVATGETEHPKRRAMGFSKYALEREEELPTRRQKRKTVRRRPERSN